MWAKERLYVFCQVVGWSFLVLLQLVYAHLFGKPGQDNNYATAVQMVLFGLLLTHYSRRLIARWGWKNLGWRGLYFFYHLFDRFNRLGLERLRLAASVKEAELRALKSQINPHFIFNSLNAMEARLDPKFFFRANRRQIVNLTWTDKIEPWFSGGLLVYLKGGAKVELSRRQAQDFREKMSL